ncbi:MAG: cyclic peptide export ABC transporter [Opitutales bacterium]|nr:cyclic peptide export ABC transporter [Opitutales bacterium]
MKTFYEFIRRESSEFRLPLLLMAIFAGIVNGLAVSVAIKSISMLRPGVLPFEQMVKFAACIAAFWISKEHVLNRTTRIVEGIVQNVRMRILRKIRNTDLLVFESMDSGRVYTTLSTDAMAISVSAGAVINASSSVVMLAFIVVFIGVNSIHALFITAGMIMLTVLYYLHKSRDVASQLREASIRENVFFDNLHGVLTGFKEFKLNRKKADDFYEKELADVVSETSQLRTRAGMAMNHSVLIGQSFLFFTVAGLLFILPNIKPDDISIIGMLVPIVLFSAGPIGDVVVAIPDLAKAEASIRNIQDLEALIESGSSPVEQKVEEVVDAEVVDFDSLELKQVSFQYPTTGTRPFTVQPFDFTLRKGEIVFLIGGNGSGKSTVLKLLTALYPPVTGSLFLNGEEIREEGLARFRNLFTTIFTDFFLFRRLLGAKRMERDRILRLMDEFELKGKTDIVDGCITNTRLSTGQRKRLALIVAMLEDKPVYVFDEWAADQDPVFRKYFYHVILQDLKNRGKAVLAVTHDDHFFGVADRVFQMEYGTLLPYDVKAHHPISTAR